MAFICAIVGLLEQITRNSIQRNQINYLQDVYRILVDVRVGYSSGHHQPVEH